MILEIACPQDMKPVGRASPPDAFIRVVGVVVFGDHAPAAEAAGMAAAETELPAAEPPQPGNGHLEHANHSQWKQGAHHRCNGEEVRGPDGLLKMPERDRQAPRRVSNAHAHQCGVANLCAVMGAADRNEVTTARCARSWDLRPGLQPRHREWTADVSLPDGTGLQSCSAQNKLRQSQALEDPTHVDKSGCRKGSSCQKQVLRMTTGMAISGSRRPVIWCAANSCCENKIFLSGRVEI